MQNRPVVLTGSRIDWLTDWLLLLLVKESDSQLLAADSTRIGRLTAAGLTAALACLFS